ncbi:MAG: hypothetical protein K2M08_07870 [Anaeroplasmataceae bacterium]|nr:hypothetical protein [Anaeroplasmataceae bacterium]
MAYVFIILLVLFCVYESYSLVVSIRKKRKENKEDKGLKALVEQGIADGSLFEKDGKLYIVDTEENSQEILEEGEKQE